MGDDLSTGAKIGIGLVILCFLIVIVLSLLMVVKNITNSGANQMEGGLNQMMSTTYDDYDQKIVTGTKVKAAVKLFASDPIGIVIDTKYNNTEGKYVYNYGLKLDSCMGTGFHKDSALDSKWGDALVLQGTVANNATSRFNEDGVSIQGVAPTKAEYNLNTRPIAASGTTTFVRDNGKYQSYLIKDSTDTIIGIYFQLAA